MSYAMRPSSPVYSLSFHLQYYWKKG